MGKKVYVRSQQELTRQKIKFGLSLRVSPKVIAKKARVTERTVANIKRRRQIQRLRGSGRKKILSQSDKMRVLHRLRKNPFLPLGDIKAELNLACSVGTLRNYLRNSGFKWRKPDQKLPLTATNRDSRLEWCREYQNSRSWNKVIFSDEASFWIFDNDKSGWFKTGYSDPLITDYYKGRLNVWAAISPKGKVGIHVFDQTLDSKKYIEILRTVLIREANQLYSRGWLLQQDNHPVHTSQASQEFMKGKIKTIDWPPYSADLSPIENLWPVLKRNVRQRLPQTIAQLRNYIYEEWDNLSHNYIVDLCESIHRRIVLCIQNNGDKIKY